MSPGEIRDRLLEAEAKWRWAVTDQLLEAESKKRAITDRLIEAEHGRRCSST